MRRTFTRLAATLACGLAIAATATPARAQPAPGKGETLRFQDYPGPGNVLVRAAIAKGFCTKQNVKCELRPFNNGPLGAQAFMAGDVDVAYMPTEIALQLLTKGADVKAVAGGVSHSPFFLVVSAALDAPNAGKGYPAAMSDLKGRKIGVPARGAAAELQLVELLKGAGMSESDVTMIALGGPATAFPALAAKQVDALMMFSPVDGFCDVLKACRVVVDLRKAEGPKSLDDTHGASSPYFVKGEWANRNPHLVQAVRALLRDAEAFVKDPANVKEVNDVTESYFKIDHPQGRAILESTMRQSIPTLSTTLKPAAMQAIADYLVATRQLPAAVDASRLLLK